MAPRASSSLEEAFIWALSEPFAVWVDGKKEIIGGFDAFAKAMLSDLGSLTFKERLALVRELVKLRPASEVVPQHQPSAATIESVVARLAAEHEKECRHEEDLRRRGIDLH